MPYTLFFVVYAIIAPFVPGVQAGRNFHQTHYHAQVSAGRY